MTKVDVVSAILNGEVDDDLEAVSEALKVRFAQRRQTRRLVAAATMEPGTLVRIVGRVKPRYLAGVEGVVTSIENGKCSVKLDALNMIKAQRYASRTTGGMRGVPVELLEVIDQIGEN